MFALAANGFNKPSETFIRSHARLLAAGDTLLIAERRERQTPIIAPAVIMSKRWPIFLRSGASPVEIALSAFSFARIGKSRSQFLASILIKHQVHTIMAEYGSTAIHLMDAARIAGCKFFVHFHGVDASKMLRDPVMVQSYQRLFEQAEGIIAPSRFLANNLANIGCPTDKLHVVPCGVDTDAITPSEPEPFRLLAVGRFTEKKSPLSTIAAFAQVAEKYPTAKLEMLGDGPLMQDAKANIDRLGLQNQVSLPGMVNPNQVQQAMSRASIFVQHSVTAENGDIEGLPVAILEAMAAGLPVVSTIHSGIPEAVLDNVTGYLVPEFDIDMMAQRICALLADPDTARAFGQAARDRVMGEFSQINTIKKLQQILGL